MLPRRGPPRRVFGRYNVVMKPSEQFWQRFPDLNPREAADQLAWLILLLEQDTCSDRLANDSDVCDALSLALDAMYAIRPVDLKAGLDQMADEMADEVDD